MPMRHRRWAAGSATPCDDLEVVLKYRSEAMTPFLKGHFPEHLRSHYRSRPEDAGRGGRCYRLGHVPGIASFSIHEGLPVTADHSSAETAGTGIDTSVPHSARIWNYWLRGKGHSQGA